VEKMRWPTGVVLLLDGDDNVHKIVREFLAFTEYTFWHATTAQDAYNARVLVISVGGAIVVGTGLLYTARNYRLSRRGQSRSM